MKTWHFLQPSSKLWRMWKPDWIPGNTQLETPSCIIQQVRDCFCLGWLQTVLAAFLYVIQQLLYVMLCFFFCKVILKEWGFFLFFPWSLFPKFDHVLFAIEKLICIREVLVFNSNSSSWSVFFMSTCHLHSLFSSAQRTLLGLVSLFVAIKKIHIFVNVVYKYTTDNFCEAVK